MKTLEELMALRDAAKAKMTVREDSSEITRIVVGMATCGIAAGARPVLNAFVEEVAKAGLTDSVSVLQTGRKPEPDNLPCADSETSGCP